MRRFFAPGNTNDSQRPEHQRAYLPLPVIRIRIPRTALGAVLSDYYCCALQSSLLSPILVTNEDIRDGSETLRECWVRNELCIAMAQRR